MFKQETLNKYAEVVAAAEGDNSVITQLVLQQCDKAVDDGSEVDLREWVDALERRNNGLVLFEDEEYEDYRITAAMNSIIFKK